MAIYFPYRCDKKTANFHLKRKKEGEKKKRKAGPLKIPNTFFYKMFVDGADYSLASPP